MTPRAYSILEQRIHSWKTAHSWIAASGVVALLLVLGAESDLYSFPRRLRAAAGGVVFASMGFHLLRGYGREEKFLGKPQTGFYKWLFAVFFNLWFSMALACFAFALL